MKKKASCMKPAVQIFNDYCENFDDFYREDLMLLTEVLPKNFDRSNPMLLRQISLKITCFR